MTTIVHFVHWLAMLTWIGGFIGILVTQKHQPVAMVNSLWQFRKYAFAGIIVSLLSGVFRVQTLGGMKAIPVLIHIKITLAMLMMIATGIALMALLPKAKAAVDSGNTVLPLPGYKGIMICVGLSIAMALGIGYILAKLQAI